MSLFDIEITNIRGGNQTLAPYRSQVLLIVNTATKCGYAPQFKGLQRLYETYRDEGIVVLGFPSGQFHQELDDNAEIAAACELNHGVTFPLFAKIDVNGESAHPLFRLLSNEARGLFGSRMIKWNFTKFLADRNGRVVRRFSPNDKPEHLEELIKKLLANKPSP